MITKFVAIAMQKCGNHGIIHWICNQSKETLLHCNNNYNAVWNDVNLSKIKVRTGGGDYIVDGSLTTNYIFNLEEFDLKYFDELSTKSIFSDNPLILIFGRDPFNWLASCYNDKFMSPQKIRYTELTRAWCPAFSPYLTFSSRIDTYKQHMFEVLGKTNYLKGHDFVFINYNRWHVDKAYRDVLSEQLDLNKGSKGKDWGKDGLFLFSNFREVNMPTDKNSVLLRYKIFKNDKEYRQLCNDDELMGISKEIFDFVPEWGGI